jgi:Flp pilus assembly protein TadG
VGIDDGHAPVVLQHGDVTGHLDSERMMVGSERGSAVVEFAFVLPLLLVLMFGIMEVAVVARSEIQLLHAAREGARAAAASPDAAVAANAARSALGPQGVNARISVVRPASVGSKATVTISLRHSVAAPLFGGFPVDLGATASMRVER